MKNNYYFTKSKNKRRFNFHGPIGLCPYCKTNKILWMPEIDKNICLNNKCKYYLDIID